MTGEGLTGGCHCGALAMRFEVSLPLDELVLRGCGCTFCQRHGAIAATDPGGRVVFTVRRPEALRRYRFGLGTADFLICGDCGVYVGAVAQVDGRCYATINVRALEAPALAGREVVPVSYEGESVEARLARRAQRWTPAVVEGA